MEITKTPILLAIWRNHGNLPRMGDFENRYFDATDYVEAWDQFLKEKFLGSAVYLFYKGELQAHANLELEPPGFKREVS